MKVAESKRNNERESMTGGLEDWRIGGGGEKGDHGWAVNGSKDMIGYGCLCFEISFLFFFFLLHFE